MAVELNNLVPEVAVADIKVANTTETLFSPKLVLPKGSLVPGAVLRLHMTGLLTTAGSATGTLKLDLKGGVTDSEASLLAITTGTLTASKTSLGWDLVAEITVRTINHDDDGTADDGDMVGGMKLWGNDHASAETVKDCIRMGSTDIDTEEENTFFVNATMSGGAADNFITMEQAVWEVLK